MELSDLANSLREQAKANSTIVLDTTVLPSSVLDDLRTAFGLATDANLTITGVQASDVPTPTADTLTITGGKASVLNQSGVGIDLTFTAPGGVLQAIIVANMDPSWKFSNSFPGLDVFPFNNLETSDARFVYATADQPAYAWPEDSSHTIDLPQGLNFLADVTVGNLPLVISLLKNLIKADQFFKLYGPFAPSANEPLPVGTLRAPLATGSFDVGVQPNALTLSTPALAVRIGSSTADNPVQQIDLLVEADFQETLEVAVTIPRSDGSLTITTTPLPHRGDINSLIEMLPGGQDFTDYIPSELSSIFAAVGLDNFSMVIDPTPKVTYLGLSISTRQPWPVIPGTPDVLVLEELTLRVQTIDPTGMNWTQVSIVAAADFLPNIFNEPFSFTVDLEKQTSWEIETVSGAYYGLVSLADIVGGLLSSPDSVPSVLREIQFSNFVVNASRSSPGLPFTYSFYGSVEAAFPMLGTELTAQLNLAVIETSAGHDITLSGAFVIGEEDFTFTLDLGTDDSKLSATWTQTDNPLEIADIARAFNFPDEDIPTIPEGLDLALKVATLTYDFGKKELVIGFDSETYGTAVFAAMQNPANQNKWQFFFGLDIGKAISLTNLPLVEKFLPHDDSIEINQIRVVLSSFQIDANLAGSLNDLITSLGSEYPQAPNPDNKGMPAGVNFSLNVDFGSIQLPIVLGTGASSGATTPSALPPGPVTAMDTTSQTQADGAPPAAPPSSQGSVKWFTVGKSFGPVSFQRVGVQYQDSKLFFLLDASVGFSALTLGLEGLGVGSPLTSFEPEVHISGVSISFDSPPVTIKGGFLVVPPPLPAGVTEEYMGEVVIAIDPYLIAGVGAYAKVNGEPSVFVFAQVKGEFGGPPAFFITGFMGGFGYNSQLSLPAADQVSTFPFIAGLDDPTIFGSATPTPMQVLTALSGVVTPTTGENWIAAGIMFRSFELVLGRALLVVTFGKDFEVALLGLASMSLPQGATTDAYAYVELQLEAVFKPNEGSFSIIASLTQNSFLLTRDCHLTGGFAFCLWFGSNPHAGDFVVTVGGYHPAFVVPAWYPQVAPVGFNWNVGGGVTVKGGAYFALTPTAAMAGGSLEVLYHSGDLKAWFTAWANIMIRWKPFYFTAGIGISIGASYRLNLLFTTVTISVELGASLDLWGPPTGGIVHIHWYIISFSVGFGADPIDPDQMTLGWSDFQALLPNNPPSSQTQAPSVHAMAKAMVVADAPAGSPTSILLTVNINSGLSRKDSSGTWIVRGDELSFTTQGAIPASSVQISGHTLDLPDGAPAKINIRPMKQTAVTSIHAVKLTFVDEKKDRDLTTWRTPTTQTANLPEALWGAPLSDDATPAPTAATISGLQTGVSLTAPPATAGAVVGPLDPASLIDPLGGGFMPLVPGTQADPIAAPVVDTNSITEIMNSLASPNAIQFQQKLVTALAQVDAAPPTSSPLTQLAQQAGTLFSQAPLRTAGSQ